ncbi:hypothetical protein FE781_09295 [Paenibacillus thermoaerophilus]|nr:hypothetical protein FE781_09295 [Paenibacillus thermoaerophilus]
MHGRIRVFHQRRRVPAVLRINGRAKAGADVNLQPVHRIRLVDRVQDALGNLADMPVVSHGVRDDADLVAADPGRAPFGRAQGEDAVRNDVHETVAHLVTVAVVNGSEAVQVHGQHRQLHILSSRLLNGLVELPAEDASVGQARLGIDKSQPAKSLRQRPQQND